MQPFRRIRGNHILLMISVLLWLEPGPAMAQKARIRPLDPLYQRIAADLKQGKPLVVTVHVALCDNNIIWCGYKGSGNGDEPRRNLYWGKAGLPTFFTRGKGYRRIFSDQGDGKKILQRVVFRHRVRRPAARWRRLGVTKAFDVIVVGLAYRGSRIGDANDALVRQVMQQQGDSLRLADGAVIDYGGKGHVVGYAGHNHLLDVSSYSFPKVTRTRPVGFFAMSCWSALYLAKKLKHSHSHALLLSLTKMYPGPFVIHGLVRGIAAGESQHRIWERGVKMYARYQRTSARRIRGAFIHGQQKRFQRRFGAITTKTTK